MKKLVLVTMVFAVIMFLFTVSAFAEIVVETQQDGSYLVKELTEKTLASIPPLPKGISFDKEVIFQLYSGKLPGVVVKSKRERKITSLFPPTTTIKVASDVYVKFVSGKWKLIGLPIKSGVEKRDISLSLLLTFIFVGVLAASIINILNNNSLTLTIFLLIIFTATAAVVGVGVGVAVAVAVAAVVGVGVAIFTATAAATIAVAIVVTAVVAAVVAVGVVIGVSDTEVIQQYFLFLVMTEITTFTIAAGVKKIRDNYKTRKSATSVPKETS